MLGLLRGVAQDDVAVHKTMHPVVARALGAVAAVEGGEEAVARAGEEVVAKAGEEVTAGEVVAADRVWEAAWGAAPDGAWPGSRNGTTSSRCSNDAETRSRRSWPPWRRS